MFWMLLSPVDKRLNSSGDGYRFFWAHASHFGGMRLWFAPNDQHHVENTIDIHRTGKML
jgi:hypothetical protein